MKIVINRCFGGFLLSEAGSRAYWGRKGKSVFVVGHGMFKFYFDEPMPEQFALPSGKHLMGRDHPENALSHLGRLDAAAYENYSKWYSEHHLSCRDIDRQDPDLIAVVEELGKQADGDCASLSVVEIPDDVDWEISEYDGNETIEEKHRSWC